MNHQLHWYACECRPDLAPPPQVGSFPNWDVWGEWNGRFRDDVRRFIKGDQGCKPAFATRLAGSADLYHVNQRCSAPSPPPVPSRTFLSGCKAGSFDHSRSLLACEGC